MQDKVNKSTKSENETVHASVGTFLVAKACMFLQKHRRFIGYEVNPSCVIEARTQLILLYDRQVSSS